MWRWSYASFAKRISKAVFSTYVEVILSQFNFTVKNICILHVCGGDPWNFESGGLNPGYSPRMWRWSLKNYFWHSNEFVFSTYVEVIHQLIDITLWSLSILHVCGGDPSTQDYTSKVYRYSPRMWRWSQQKLQADELVRVFSTYVEVILSSADLKTIANSILHVCGGDPIWHINRRIINRYSPRMWRWSWTYRGISKCPSVFSTYVEVILVCMECL